ncbi:MAG: hypothetical protein ACI9YU_001856 [Flavobacteriales bacterium]|jgi:hypothetical protein
MIRCGSPKDSIYSITGFSQPPAKGVPKMPTANSAQIRTRVIRKATPAIIRKLFFLMVLKVNSSSVPVPKRRAAAIMKSIVAQFTLPVNCMAIRGISKIPAPTMPMMSGLRLVISMVSININRFPEIKFNEILRGFKSALWLKELVRQRF